MGWKNYHPYIFEKENLQYGDVSEEDLGTLNIDGANTSLNILLRTEGDKMNYVYDFVDNWEHVILLEKASLSDRGVLSHVPICIEGKETCPSEDSSGLWGYYENLKNVRDVNYPERKELHDWLIRDIGERKYNLEVINLRLTNLHC